METTKNINVHFRYVGLPITDGEIPGICFCYPNKTIAIESYAIIHDYLTTLGSDKSFRIEFIKGADNKYILIMTIVTPNYSSDTNITGINQVDVKKLNDALDNVAYYMILAGYFQKGEFLLLSPTDYHMFKNDIIIDGKIITGNPVYEVDWINILRQ